ncbi:RraA family protein [Ensifer sp. ENS05]|uniref:RraA family protein n=1 Tax=Ensifer sp. ENS05 TaxID=2769277 RepID=UPI00177FA89A|nr:RraA family protein [Ensifer sp. ENS05]MBD9597296.1 RraA family protein [Ensifer sp. ENS05]
MTSLQAKKEEVSVKQSLGRIAPERITQFEIERPDQALIDKLKTIGDPTSTVADALDDLGLDKQIVSASTLVPGMHGKVMIGPAVTIRNVPLTDNLSPLQRANRGSIKLAEIEAHNLSIEGDVLVMEGVHGVSNMGGVSSEISRRQGAQGAIVSGGVRDVDHSRSVDYGVWASERTPLTGKWRIETIEVNGPVKIFGAHVEPGDVVVADDTGVCFIPRRFLPIVVENVLRKSDIEERRLEAIRAGVALSAPNVRQPDERC